MDRVEFELLKLKISKEFVSIRIISDSMEPLLTVNEPVNLFALPETLHPFDLIVFFEKDSLTCHFVWKVQKDLDGSILTRSLKNPYHNDLPHPAKDILGWVPNKKISYLSRLKIILFNLLRGTL